MVRSTGVAALDQVAFLVPGDEAVGDLGGPVTDGGHRLEHPAALPRPAMRPRPADWAGAAQLTGQPVREGASRGDEQ